MLCYAMYRAQHNHHNKEGKGGGVGGVGLVKEMRFCWFLGYISYLFKLLEQRTMGGVKKGEGCWKMVENYPLLYLSSFFNLI